MKNFITKLSVVTFSLSFVFLSASVAHAQGWVQPNLPPLTDNTPVPVNVGPLGQIKQGWLQVGGSNATGNDEGVYADRVGGQRVTARAFCLLASEQHILDWTHGDALKYFYSNGPDIPLITQTNQSTIDVADCITAWPTGGSSLPTTGNDGDVLTWDSATSTWVPLPALPAGTANQTMRHNGADWVANNELLSDGNKVRVGAGVPFGGFFNNVKFGVDGITFLNGGSWLNGGTTFTGGPLTINDLYNQNNNGTNVPGTVLTNVAGDGVATWQPIFATGTGPVPNGSGNTAGDTLWWNGTTWIADQGIGNDGTNVRVNMPLTSYPTAHFGVDGISVFTGGGLFIQGLFGLVDGTQGADKVLTSNAAGLASWKTPLAGPGTTVGETTYWDGTKWLPNINIKNDGNKVAVNGDLFVPGGQNEAEFQINAEGDSMGNDWWGTGQGWGHPLALQGYGQRLMAGVDTSRQNAYFQSVKQSTNGNSVSAIALNPQGGNVRVGSIDQTTGIPGNTNDTFGVTGNSLFKGSVTIQDGSQGLGKVLKSDASGLASWQPEFGLTPGTTDGQILVWNNTTETWGPQNAGPTIDQGTMNDTLRWDSTGAGRWVASDLMNNDGSTISIRKPSSLSGSSIFQALALTSPVPKGLEVYSEGSTTTEGLGVFGNLIVGADSNGGNRLVNFYGPLKVKARDVWGTVAEFIGNGDVRIKPGSNAGTVNIGSGSTLGVPLHVTGSVFAHDAGYTSPTGAVYVSSDTIVCGTTTIPGVAAGNDGLPFLNSGQAGAITINLYNSSCPGISPITTIASSNTNSTCTVNSTYPLIAADCTNSLYNADANAPATVYELYAVPQLSGWIPGGSLNYNLRALKFIKQTSGANGQGNFIGNGAILSSLDSTVAPGVDQYGNWSDVCADGNGRLVKCEPEQVAPPTYNVPDIRIVEAKWKVISESDWKSLSCGAGYAAIAVSCDSDEDPGPDTCKLAGLHEAEMDNNYSAFWDSSGTQYDWEEQANAGKYWGGYVSTSQNGTQNNPKIVSMAVTCMRYYQ